MTSTVEFSGHDDTQLELESTAGLMDAYDRRERCVELVDVQHRDDDCAFVYESRHADRIGSQLLKYCGINSSVAQ
jgi:hypothetical protein